MAMEAGTPAPLGGSQMPAGAVPVGPASPAWVDVWRRFRRNRLALAGVAMAGLLTLAAALAPVITSYDPVAIDTSASRVPPSAAHWFGTDLVGRDVFARVVYGARVSLQVAILATAIAVTLGLLAGAAAGYLGGGVDAVIMRSVDVLLAFPFILAAMVVVSVVGKGRGMVVLVLGLLGWMQLARVFRSSVLQVKQNEYVLAGRAMGCGGGRLVLRHIVPNAVQPVIVLGTIFVGAAVLGEAALSFLGVGITEPEPSWGLMVADGRRFLFTSPHLLFFPGMAIFLTVMAFVFIGDGLRDALDPRLRER